ncbi:MAG: aminotransferase [Pseudomonadota bacterium]
MTNFNINNDNILKQRDHNEVSYDDVSKWDNRHYVHPWQVMDQKDDDRLIASNAEGIYLYDHHHKRYIDGPGGMWNMQIGYGRKEMAETIAHQAMQLTYHSPWSFASRPGSILARKLAELSPGDLNRVFFTTGGSSAVDTALRFVFFYNNVRGKTDKKKIIAREKGYHGSTYLSATMSGKERDQKHMDTEKRLVHFLPNVNPYLRPNDMTLDQWCDEKIQDLEQAILKEGADQVAAFIAEPVLSSGGVIIPPKNYHKSCLEICRKYDVLYISDEVVTAFGRLGHWFASEDVFGIVPDIITCAKGLTSGYMPLGAVLISEKLLKETEEIDQGQTAFSNGFTYSGHPVACAAALKNMDIIERENLLKHVQQIAPYFQEKLHALRKHDIVVDTRGIGLIGCIEGSPTIHIKEEDRLQQDYQFGALLDQTCEEMGLIVRPIINMCVFSPPLIITKSQIDEMYDILDRALTKVSRSLLS